MKLNESRSEPSDLEDGLQRVRDCGYVASLKPSPEEEAAQVYLYRDVLLRDERNRGR